VIAAARPAVETILAVMLRRANSKTEPCVTIQTKSAAATASSPLQQPCVVPALANVIRRKNVAGIPLLVQPILRRLMVKVVVMASNVLLGIAHHETSSARLSWAHIRKATILMLATR
jgi:hypothetical protein